MKHSQFNHDGSRFDLIHFHEGETLCAGEPLFGLVVLKFEEDSCSWSNNDKVDVKGGQTGSSRSDVLKKRRKGYLLPFGNFSTCL